MSRLGAPSLLPASPWHRRNDAALGVRHDAKPPEAPPAACLPHKYTRLPLFSLSSSVVIVIKDMPVWPDPCVDDLSGMETFGSAMGGSCNAPPRGKSTEFDRPDQKSDSFIDNNDWHDGQRPRKQVDISQRLSAFIGSARAEWAGWRKDL